MDIAIPFVKLLVFIALVAMAIVGYLVAVIARQEGHLRRAAAKLRGLFQQSDRLRVHLRVHAAQFDRGLLAGRVLQRQSGHADPAESLVSADHAGVHSGHHDEHLVGRTPRRDRRTAADDSRHRRRHRDGQVPGGRGDFLRRTAVVDADQLHGPGIPGVGRCRCGLVHHDLHRLLVHRHGHAGAGHGGLVPDQQPDGRLHSGSAVQCSAGVLDVRRSGDSRSQSGARSFLVELRRAVCRFWSWRAQSRCHFVLRSAGLVRRLRQPGHDRPPTLVRRQGRLDAGPFPSS